MMWPALFRAIVFSALGLAAALGGFKLVKSQKAPAGETRFVHFYSPCVLLTDLGWLLVFIGLFVIFLGAPMVYIAYRSG